MEPRYPGAVDQLLNFGEYWDDELIAPNEDRIIECARTRKLAVQYGIQPIKRKG